LYIKRYVSIVKFWLKLSHSENVIIKAIVKSGLIDCLNGKSNRFTNVKTLRLSMDFYINGIISTRNVSLPIAYAFLSMSKQRLIDELTQEWQTYINKMEVLDLYNYVKDTLEMEPYLNSIASRNLRIGLTRLRISAHSLRIQTGRYGIDRLERNLRVCQICNGNKIADEFHFVLNCPAFHSIRLEYIENVFRTKPSMFKFTQLLSSKKQVKYCHVSKIYT
jgi:hypothetical protein